jgi:tetratricopeptide (TPR) repeat protein
MSRMLNLAEGLLGMGRTYQQIGRTRDAFTILSRLSRFRELPRDVAEETHARLGEIQLQRKQYPRACRHLTIALSLDPDNPRYHRLLASALRPQGEEQWERAAAHYQRAL